jgi:hypothetical protein
MSTVYTVTSVFGEKATVIPDLEGSCSSCAENCAKCTAGITVLNNHNFQIKKGDKVKIGITSRKENIRGIFSLFFPIACAAAGYFVPSLCFSSPGESTRAFFVLLFLAAGAAVVFCITRCKPDKNQLEIISVS